MIPNRDRYILSGHKITVKPALVLVYSRRGFLVACLVRNPPAIFMETLFGFLDLEDLLEKIAYPIL